MLLVESTKLGNNFKFFEQWQWSIAGFENTIGSARLDSPVEVLSHCQVTSRTSAMQPTLIRLSVLPRISQPIKRSQEGLFHGKMKQYGNNVPHSKHKTRRTWLPNVQSKRLQLEATGEMIKLKVTTRALRCIHKVL